MLVVSNSVPSLRDENIVTQFQLTIFAQPQLLYLVVFHSIFPYFLSKAADELQNIHLSPHHTDALFSDICINSIFPTPIQGYVLTDELQHVHIYTKYHPTSSPQTDQEDCSARAKWTMKNLRQ